MKTEVTRLPGRWFGLAAIGASALVLGLDITILITACLLYTSPSPRDS